METEQQKENKTWEDIERERVRGRAHDKEREGVLGRYRKSEKQRGSHKKAYESVIYEKFGTLIEKATERERKIEREIRAMEW